MAGQDTNLQASGTQTVTHVDKSRNTEPGKMCHTECKHNGKMSRTIDIITCCICGHNYHKDCAELDIQTVWTCYTCRLLPDTVLMLSSKIDTLISMILEQKEMIEVLQQSQSQASAAIGLHNTDIKKLVSQLSDSDTSPADSDDEVTDDETEPDYTGMLLIGDSIIRNIQSTSDDLIVESHSGAKACDIKKCLQKLKPRHKRFTDIFIVCGTNDSATKRNAEKITRDFEALLTTAKDRAQHVHLASVLPRADDKADMVKIDNVNQLLTTTANNLNVNFVNNDKNFRYRDDTIDETLLLNTDKLHLSPLGVHKLLQNLNLQDKAKTSFGNGPVSRWDTVPADGGYHTLKHKRDKSPIPPSVSLTDYSGPVYTNNENIVKFRGPRSPLSNFYECNIEVWDVKFPTTEHAYNYRKAIEMGYHVTAESIRRASTAREAQIIANDIETDDIWTDMKQKVMYQLLQEKVRQCPAFRDELRSTNEKILVEDTGNEYWGRGRSGKGLNMLDHLLMTLRRNMPGNTSSRVPDGYYRHPSRHHTYLHRNDQQLKCYNCGEKSHLLNTCRHPSPIQCYACHDLGHKQKFCPKRSH